MISGHGNIQNAVAATRLGAADFIEKPFSVSGLLTSIERVLERESGGSADARRRVGRRRGVSRPAPRRGSRGAGSAPRALDGDRRGRGSIPDSRPV